MVANILSAKLVQVPYFAAINIPAGLIISPLTFMLTALTTELYGISKARTMVVTAFVMTIISCAFIELAIFLPTKDLENQAAFQRILGLNAIIIASSLTAYGMSQMVEIQSYAKIKEWTGPRMLWLRNNAAILLSQLVDTMIVNMLYLYWGIGLELAEVSEIIVFSYGYKIILSTMSTPLLYLCVFLKQRSIANS